MKRALLLVAALLSFNARADYLSGNVLHKWLGAGLSPERLSASFYITGVADTASILENDLKKPVFCPATGVKAGQLTDVVRLYLEKHPEERHKQASELVLTALARAFPCRAR